MAVGIVVDDAIMVMENIFRHFEEGKDRVTAAREGTGEITFAALSATIAIIAIYRLGSTVPAPFVSFPNVSECLAQNSGTEGLLGLVNLFSGGALLQHLKETGGSTKGAVLPEEPAQKLTRRELEILRLVAGGLQPEHYLTRKNGKDANENAEFDWSATQVRLSRDGQTRPVAPGTQDILSLNYHLAYVRQPESGATLGVVTGKKYERYALDALGEEDIDTPAGHFRTLHLRAMTDSTTEIWLALDHHRLPVKIRFTDKKGDVFEQIATELGTP